MVVLSLDPKNFFFFHPKEDEYEILGLEFLYLSVIGALLYLAQYTKPDISCAMNLLAITVSRQHAATGMASKTYFDTLKLLRI